MELRSTHKELPHPDRVIVHRKGVPGNEEEEHLAFELRCYPNNAQVCKGYPVYTLCKHFHQNMQACTASRLISSCMIGSSIAEIGQLSLAL